MMIKDKLGLPVGLDDTEREDLREYDTEPHGLDHELCQEVGGQAAEVLESAYGVPTSDLDKPLNSLGVIPDGMYAASCDEDRSLQDDVEGGIVEHEGVIFYAVTNHGRQYYGENPKEHNDDAYLVIPEQKTIGALDGVSGKVLRGDKGRVAAFLAVLAALSEANSEIHLVKLMEGMHEIVLKHRLDIQEMWAQQQKDPQDAPKHVTTATIARLNENNIIECANIGNTKAIVIRGDKPFCLTYEHTELNRMMAYLEITEEEAIKRFGRLAGYFKNELTQAIGNPDNIHPNDDYESEDLHMNINPFYETFQAQAGDILLLCSDGVTNIMTDDEIAVFVHERAQQGKNLVEIIEELKDYILEEMKKDGCGDNIVIVGLFVPE